MEKQPEEIKVCRLQVVLMPNGEVVCNGKSVGWFDKLSKYLEPELDQHA